MGLQRGCQQPGNGRARAPLQYVHGRGPGTGSRPGTGSHPAQTCRQELIDCMEDDGTQGCKWYLYDQYQGDAQFYSPDTCDQWDACKALTDCAPGEFKDTGPTETGLRLLKMAAQV